MYEEFIQSNVDIALSEEELETSDGIEKIIDKLAETLEEVEYSYTDLDDVYFNFSHYSTQKDKNGFQRQFKVYKADTEQMDDRLNQLAKRLSAPGGSEL